MWQYGAEAWAFDPLLTVFEKQVFAMSTVHFSYSALVLLQDASICLASSVVCESLFSPGNNIQH